MRDQSRMTLLIDCQSCPVRDVACGECMVTAMAEYARENPSPELPDAKPQTVAEGLALDRREQRAVDLLAELGMVTQQTAMTAVAQRERWGAYRDVG